MQSEPRHLAKQSLSIVDVGEEGSAEPQWKHLKSVEKGKQSRLVEILTRPVWLQLWLAAGLSKPLFLAGHGYRFQARKARRDRVRMDSCRWHIYFPTGRYAVPSVLVEPKTFADHQMPLRSQSNERWGLQDWLGGINDMVREVGAAGG